MQELEQKNPFVLFEQLINSEDTKKMYMFYLKRYMEFLDGQDPFCENDTRAIESKMINYIIDMKQQQKAILQSKITYLLYWHFTR